MPGHTQATQKLTLFRVRFLPFQPNKAERNEMKATRRFSVSRLALGHSQTKESKMLEYTVHFQKGSRVGTRSLRMEHVSAENSEAAIKAAKKLFPNFRAEGYRLTRVDHFDDNGLVIDL